MAGFWRDVGTNTVASFVVAAVLAVVGGAIAWWPDESLRPWVLAGCYVAFVSLVVFLRIWRLAKTAMSRGGVQPVSDAGANILFAAVGGFVIVVVASARQIVVDAHTAHGIGWILIMNLAVLLPFRIAFVINQAFTKPKDDGVAKVTYSMPPKSRAIFGSILRAVSTVFYVLVVAALVFIYDISTGSATLAAWSQWRP